VFTYSHEEGTRAFALLDDVPGPVKRRRRNAVMARQKRLVAQAHRARVGSEVDLLIDGPSPDHPMVIQGRLEGQAPDIDSVVYLTDCDPSEYAAGDLIRARVVSSRGYDLVAVPLVEVTTATLRTLNPEP
jgi:ribosomal protein S12 methylthiotransferase